MARSRAQGSIEYLLILGAVILVSAVVIGLLASMQYDDPKKSTVFASDAFSKLQHGNDAIIVTEGLADSSGDVILKLLGNSDSNVFVRNIRGNSAGDNSFDDVLILPQGEPVNFPLASFGDTCECTAGQTEINCDFVIAFMTDAGLRTQSLSSLIQCAQGNLDVLPPVINSSNPASLVFGTNSYILIFTTNEDANCRYDTIFKTAFANMRYGFSGLLLSHSATITGLVTGDNNIYVKCKDVANNINQTDFNIKIIVSSPSIPLSTPFVWIVNNTGNNVSRLSISGTVSGHYGVGNYPFGAAVDGGGNVWVTNGTSNTVSKLSSSGGWLGTFPVGNSPEGIAIDADGNILVANFDGTISKLSSLGVPLDTFNIGGQPWGIAVNMDGTIWITDRSGSNTVSKLSSLGASLGTFTVGDTPWGIAVDADGNVWVTNYFNNSVSKLNSSGNSFGPYPVGRHPSGIAVDKEGNIWVANNGYSSGNSTVSKLSSLGAWLGTFPVGNSPQGIAVDAENNVWVANSGSNTVSKLSSLGNPLNTISVGNRPTSFGDFTGFALQYFVLGRR